PTDDTVALAQRSMSRTQPPVPACGGGSLILFGHDLVEHPSGPLLLLLGGRPSAALVVCQVVVQIRLRNSRCRTRRKRSEVFHSVFPAVPAMRKRSFGNFAGELARHRSGPAERLLAEINGGIDALRSCFEN